MKQFFESIERKSPANKRKFASADLIMNVTEDILVMMESKQINKKQLGERLGKSRAYIGQLLSGERNMTLSTLSDVCLELGIKPKIDITPIEYSEKVFFGDKQSVEHYYYHKPSPRRGVLRLIGDGKFDTCSANDDAYQKGCYRNLG